jgi:hypothetical protein
MWRTRSSVPLPDLAHLSADVVLDSFCQAGIVGIGVSIGTDAFVRNFVAKTCRVIIDDVEKLNVILRFRTDSYIIIFSGFDRIPVCNILTLIFCLVIIVFSNSNTLIAKLLT